MAKFIVTESNFTPFTYDELVKPIMALQEKHDKTQEMYDALNMEAGAMKRYLDRDSEDSEIRKAYDATMSQLSDLQENLWNNGINARTKRDLSLAKSSYASTMPRIQEAIKKRQADSKAWGDARKQNPKLVTGIDPASGGLNNYFLDDTYGNSWFTYDSGVLEKEVATEAMTRAQDYVRDLRDSGRITENPALAGWLTRDLTKGFTNREVNDGKTVSDAVRNMTDEQRKEYYEQHNISPAAQILAETLIDRYNATGVRNANITPEEADRLWYGGQNGFYGSVLGHEIKDFQDNEYAAEQARALARYKAGLDKPTTTTLVDYDDGTLPGENQKKAEKRIEKVVGKPFEKAYITNDGSVIENAAQASALVYSQELRLQVMDKLPFDIGRDGESTSIFNSSDKFLQGRKTEASGKEYDIRFNPKRKMKYGDTVVQGVVEIRPADSNDAWEPYISNDMDYTKYYHEMRSKYKSNLEYYKKNEPELYKLASIDPDSQYDIYTKDNIDMHTPITNYEDAYRSQPNNHPNSYYDAWIARGDTDKGKLVPKLSSWLSSNLVVSSDSKGSYSADKQRKWRTFDDKFGHMHEINEYGNVEGKTITKPDNYFTFDSDGMINNILGYQLTPEGLKNNYIVLQTVQGKKIAVGLDMFSSRALRNLFDNANRQIYAYLSQHPEANEDAVASAVMDNTVAALQTLLGATTVTESKSGTLSKN